ncbi:MAG: serine/threonine protein kinase [Candidatus Wallbacteria bacterium]|nr:serine/threonine protein kinase [Candidatus Wallbacteria bacterium]
MKPTTPAVPEAAADPSETEPGARLRQGVELAGYRIEALIGSGGMGQVYRATQLSLSREVALKVMAPAIARDPQARRRFLQEGVLAARVAHPNLVAVLEVAEAGRLLVLALELVNGETLARRLERLGALPPGLACEVVSTTADVLTSLHAAGVLHRDLKPANLFLCRDRGVLVGDLGIAKDLQAAGPLTGAHVLLGTPAYMAPELVEGEPSSAAADIYALGVVFFECLAGRLPFEAEDPMELLRMHAQEPVPDLTAMRPELPAEYDAFVQRALARLPADRFSNASEMAAAARELPQVARKSGAAPAAAPLRRPEGPATVLRSTRSVRPRSGTRVVSSSRAVVAAARPRWHLWGATACLPAVGLAIWLLAPRVAAPPVAPPVAVTTPPTKVPLAAQKPAATEVALPTSAILRKAMLLSPIPAESDPDLPAARSAASAIQSSTVEALELLERYLDHPRRIDPQKTMRETFEACRKSFAPWKAAMLEAAAVGTDSAGRRAARLAAAAVSGLVEVRARLQWTLRQWVRGAPDDVAMFRQAKIPIYLDDFGEGIARNAGNVHTELSRRIPAPTTSWSIALACTEAITRLSSSRAAGVVSSPDLQARLEGALERMVLASENRMEDPAVVRGLLHAMRVVAGRYSLYASSLGAVRRVLDRLDRAGGPGDPRSRRLREELLRYELELERIWLELHAQPGKVPDAAASRKAIDEWRSMEKRLAPLAGPKSAPGRTASRRDLDLLLRVDEVRELAAGELQALKNGRPAEE